MILDIYTRSHGLRKYLINGVRKAKARTPASLLQLMNLVEIVAYERPEREINRLKEVRTAEVYHQIPFDLKRGALGLFMLEMCRKSIKEGESNPALFDFLFARFVQLDRSEAGIGNLHIHFLLRLSAYLGFLPTGDWTAETPFFDLREGGFVAKLPSHREYLAEEDALKVYELLLVDLEGVSQVAMNRIQRWRLLDGMVRFYQHHVPGMGEVNSLNVLKEVF